jgi:hypothetical protein
MSTLKYNSRSNTEMVTASRITSAGLSGREALSRAAAAAGEVVEGIITLWNNKT